MDFYNYLAYLPRLFFHPFKTLREMLEGIKSEENKKILVFSFWISLLGNVCLLLSNKLSVNTAGNSLSGIMIDIFFYLLIIYLLYFISLAIYYFLLTLSNKKTELRELIGLFLTSDFIFVVLLPLSIIFSYFPSVFTIIYGLIILIVTVFNIILKIKAIALCSVISNFGSVVLYFTPFLFSLFTLVISIVYIIMSIFKHIAN